MTWKPPAIRHDTENARLRSSKGANHKSSPRAHECILAEYDAPPEVTRENIQQVRAVWQSREERWELHVVCEHDLDTESPGDTVAGVDLGICNPATVAFPEDAVVYPGNRLREDKHYFTGDEYQTEGGNGPSQRVEWAREKLARRKTHFLHALAKDIIERCVSHNVGTLVLGDPSGVDESDWGRHGNKRLDNWASKQTMNLLDYKSRERGIEVEQRDERGTSSQCSVCGSEDDDSRIERGLWKCGRCGRSR